MGLMLKLVPSESITDVTFADENRLTPLNSLLATSPM